MAPDYLVQYRFNPASDGNQPDGTLVCAPGNSPVLYGIASTGGAGSGGTVFAFTPGSTDGSGTLSVLHAFSDGKHRQ